MPKNIYVSLCDDDADPAYFPIRDCLLMETIKDDSDMSNGNPCIGKNVVQATPLVPSTSAELLKFAQMMGWSLGKDKDGQVILYTGIQADPSKPKPKRKNCWRKKSEYLP